MRRPTRRTVPALIAAASLLVLVAAMLLRREARGELSPVARGEQLARASGCFACHGQSEEEHRANFRVTADGTWRPKRIPSLWENGIDEAAVIVEWITEGCPPDERERHEQLFVQMPAYRDHLRTDEIDAIAAWILAQGLHRVEGAGDAAEASADADAEDSVTRLVRQGDRLSRRHGCYQCHGELGQGGVPNLASFKGYIPGFFGADFRTLTDGGQRDEILHWIDHGRGRSIEQGPLGPVARRFFDGQAISMPAYENRLTAEEKAVLVDFLLHLNALGPLPAPAVEAFARRLHPAPGL